MPKLSDEEIALFRAELKDVKPIKHDKVVLRKKPPAPKRLKTSIPEPIEEFAFSDHIQKMVTGEERLLFHRAGLQPKILRSLRQGKIPQTEILDLHGTTITQARSILSQFLQHCLQTQQRCVRIIHGKGKLQLETPILKNHVNNWLQQYPDILAFCSAIPADGGTGAIYVLLRGNNKRRPA